MHVHTAVLPNRRDQDMNLVVFIYYSKKSKKMAFPLYVCVSHSDMWPVVLMTLVLLIVLPCLPVLEVFGICPSSSIKILTLAYKIVEAQKEMKLNEAQNR